ncbi:transforming growth factor-beta-induced protein ig-h3 [Diorhabda sublineata]|uniref:transforming growth factor-beta-induced protein ig-h3 n=1 Tax=Diorhabda sublineata TaxID=1163346 RepID=UPI0024E054BC|nr:transforming growth factor-beta-induced protein ig-h3 [Diorhabda sublineata]
MAGNVGISYLVCVLMTCSTSLFVDGAVVLPNTSGIDGQLTANHNVDHFFSLWLVFSNDEVKISDEPFTIFAPQNSATKRAEKLLQQPELIKKLLLDHVVLGSLIDLTNITSDTTLTTLSGKSVTVRIFKEHDLKANDANVVERRVVVPNGLLVILDGYLFAEEQETKQNNASALPTAQEKLMDVSATFSSTSNENSKNQSNATFVENIMEVLSFLKSGVRVFQHFLSRSNVSNLLQQEEEYTVFIPTDHAFQRWHPIDWGFYPFSVPEFTESVIVNHFVKGRLKQDLIKDGEIVKTIGGKEIVFRKTPNLTVNGAMLVKGDTPVARGNIMFIGEVLFVTESIVSKLHQQHKDKETPPLLAFPWFGAQFLSHAFLALERDKRFTHITRFLNLADLAPHVSGTGYTFFVPTDIAFEKIGLDRMPDNYLSTGDGLQILLNHFVKGRLYDRDLTDGVRLESLGNKTITVKRTKEEVYVNEAKIVESEVFVYNLGTMYYIDTVLFMTINTLPQTSTSTESTSTRAAAWTTPAFVEKIPEEIAEETGSMPDVLFADGFNNDNETEIASTTLDSTSTVK